MYWNSFLRWSCLLYTSNIIMQANKTQFQEVKDMLCEALEELMKDELEANRSRGLSELSLIHIFLQS